MNLRAITDAAGLAQVYQAVLVPSFPPSELVAQAWLVDGVAAGSVAVIGAYGGESLTAVAVTEAVCPGVLLLSYLASLPGHRGAGVGSQVLSHVRAATQAAGAGLLVAEVERPDRHAGSAEHGDPTARLRFYARHGARVLDLPYVQPAIRPGAEPVPGMLLLALDVDPSLLNEGGTAVDGALVAAAIEAILRDERDDDPPSAALRAAARRPLVRLLPVEDWETVTASE